MPIHNRGFELAEWQERALDAWVQGDGTPFRGTLEIFTGGGKTLIALAAAARVSATVPDLRLAVVVPAEALARQWIASIARHTDIDPSDVGLLGAGGKDSLDEKRVLVTVLNSAAKYLPDMAVANQPLMLVVDECHRAGAPSVSRVLDTPSRFRLGLSATPDRQEIGDDGERIPYADQRVGRALGKVVFTFDLRQARALGWLPSYEIHHHGLTLRDDERREYASISRRVDDVVDQLRSMGIDTGRAQSLQGAPGEVGDVARSYVSLTSLRKDLLYRATERTRVAVRLVTRELEGGDRRVLLFHERVDQAVQLFEALREALPDHKIALENSRLPDAQREEAMADFRSGRAQVLVSVKSLIEGIDVPAADMGVSVASSSSVRQRIQALGRVLRRDFSESTVAKTARMDVLYMTDTVDELIYSKEDWSDLTGDVENFYWVWSDDPEQEPELQPGPPSSPRPTEEQEWERLGGHAPSTPVRWHGMFVGQEYSMDTSGTVRNASGSTMAVPDGFEDLMSRLGHRRFGRFRVTPSHRLVLVAREGGDGIEVLVVGQLLAPLAPIAERLPLSIDEMPNVDTLAAGDAYPGPVDSDGGTYQLRLKRGGVIERKAGGGREFAITQGSGHQELEENARRLVEAWKATSPSGLTFHVNGLGHAWFESGGQRLFLASVPGGFVWPDSRGAEER